MPRERPCARCVHIRGHREPGGAEPGTLLSAENTDPNIPLAECGGPMYLGAVHVIVARAGQEAGSGLKVHPQILPCACGRNPAPIP
jgi:hypothetical protein